jgi:COMPASS component SWD2
LGGPPIHWGNINFSNNGKYLLLSTLEGSIYLFDAFKGDKLQEYATTNSENQFIEASFSPDDQFVLSGMSTNSRFVQSVVVNIADRLK